MRPLRGPGRIRPIGHPAAQLNAAVLKQVVQAWVTCHFNPKPMVGIENRESWWLPIREPDFCDRLGAVEGAAQLQPPTSLLMRGLPPHNAVPS